MFDNIRYCDLCSRRLTPEDFAVGDAIERRGKAFCVECAEIAPKTAKQRPVTAPKARRPSASSRRLRAIKRSGASSSSKHLKALKRRDRKKRRRPSTRRVASSRDILPKEKKPEETKKQEKPEEAVTLRVTCTHCGESFLVEDPNFSRDFICPACGGATRLKRPRPGAGRSRHG